MPFLQRAAVTMPHASVSTASLSSTLPPALSAASMVGSLQELYRYAIAALTSNSTRGLQLAVPYTSAPQNLPQDSTDGAACSGQSSPTSSGTGNLCALRSTATPSGFVDNPEACSSSNSHRFPPPIMAASAALPQSICSAHPSTRLGEPQFSLHAWVAAKLAGQDLHELRPRLLAQLGKPSAAERRTAVAAVSHIIQGWSAAGRQPILRGFFDASVVLSLVRAAELASDGSRGEAAESAILSGTGNSGRGEAAELATLTGTGKCGRGSTGLFAGEKKGQGVAGGHAGDSRSAAAESMLAGTCGCGPGFNEAPVSESGMPASGLHAGLDFSSQRPLDARDPSSGPAFHRLFPGAPRRAGCDPQKRDCADVLWALRGILGLHSTTAQLELGAALGGGGQGFTAAGARTNKTGMSSSSGVEDSATTSGGSGQNRRNRGKRWGPIAGLQHERSVKEAAASKEGIEAAQAVLGLMLRVLSHPGDYTPASVDAAVELLRYMTQGSPYDTHTKRELLLGQGVEVLAGFLRTLPPASARQQALEVLQSIAAEKAGPESHVVKAGTVPALLQSLLDEGSPHSFQFATQLRDALQFLVQLAASSSLARQQILQVPGALEMLTTMAGPDGPKRHGSVAPPLALRLLLGLARSGRTAREKMRQVPELVPMLIERLSLQYEYGAVRAPALAILAQLAKEDTSLPGRVAGSQIRHPSGTPPAEWFAWWKVVRHSLSGKPLSTRAAASRVKTSAK